MQLDFIFKHGAGSGLETPRNPTILVNGQALSLRLVHNRRARRYILRMGRDGGVRVTIPRGGSAAYARSFAEKNRVWLQAQLERLANSRRRPEVWALGTEILLRGERVRIQTEPGGDAPRIRVGDHHIGIAAREGEDLRPCIEGLFWELAAKELPPRVFELAARCGLKVGRVSVRNQKSRWGSCSRRGTISLNWRLIQTPPFVRDYICLHELMHLRQMNHSKAFWREVERVCPGYRNAEAWLKTHRDLLGW